MSRDRDCIFCKILQGEIPASRVYEDENFVCIRDIQPQAKTHLLVIPREHVASLEAAFPEGQAGTDRLEAEKRVGGLIAAGVKAARTQGLLPGGFRSVLNTNRDGGQTVFHLHLHILGGEALSGGFGA